MSLKLSISKADGIKDHLANAGCYLSVDEDFLDVITPLTGSLTDYLTEIPSTGLLRLLLKNMRTSEVLGSVSIQIPSLPPGTHWLPLFDDFDDDTVNKLAATVEPPRIQVTLVTDKESVHVVSAKEVKISEKKKEVVGDSRLEIMQAEFAAAMRRAEDRDLAYIEEMKASEEERLSLRAKLAEQSDLILRKESEIVYLKEQLARLSIVSYEAEFLQCKAQAVSLGDELRAAQIRIRELESSLEQTKEVAHSLSSIKSSTCKSHEDELQRLQSQLNLYKQTVSDLQKSQEKKLSDKLEAELIKQIKELDERLESSELSKAELLVEIHTLRQDLSQQERVINEMQGVIEGSRSERLSSRDERGRSPRASRRKDSIDRSLEEYHAGQGIKNNFVKLGRGLYEFGSRKVNVSMKNGTLVCRVGGGYVQIDDFLSIYAGSVSGSPRKNSGRGGSTSPMRSAKNSFVTYADASGKQTPLDSVFDEESLMTYSCDSEDDRGKLKSKFCR
jgi:hypothetical protein